MAMDPGFLTGLFVFLYGACAGSFLNVCIIRMPRGESVIRPKSYCPSCKTPIAWYDNIPMLSFLLLRGQCRTCQRRISWRYFFMESVCAWIWLGLWRYYGLTAFFGAAALFLTILLAITITDFETGLIPDGLSLTGLGLGLVWSIYFPEIHLKPSWQEGLGQALWGAGLGAGMTYLTGWLGTRLFRKESMGGGDVKLMAMIGAFVGGLKVVGVFMLAPFFALPYALYEKYGRKSETLPFGPFLALSGICFFVAGDWIIRKFLRLP